MGFLFSFVSQRLYDDVRVYISVHRPDMVFGGIGAARTAYFDAPIRCTVDLAVHWSQNRREETVFFRRFAVSSYWSNLGVPKTLTHSVINKLISLCIARSC